MAPVNKPPINIGKAFSTRVDSWDVNGPRSGALVVCSVAVEGGGVGGGGSGGDVVVVVVVVVVMVVC